MNTLIIEIVLSILVSITGGAFSQDGSSNRDSEFNFEEQYELAKKLEKQGDVKESIKIHYSILEYLERNKKNSEGYFIQLSRTYQNLTNHYVFNNDSLSLLYANKAIAAAEKTVDHELIGQSYSFKYYCLYYSGNANELNFIADKCIEYFSKIDEEKLLGEAYMHKCNALVEMGRVEEGDTYCQKAEAIFMKTESGFFLSAVLTNIGNVFLKMDDVERALSYHLKAHEVTKGLNNLQYLTNEYKNLAQDYYKLRDYKKSADFYKLFADSINKSHETLLDEKFTDAEAKFNTEQKDKEIALQKLSIAEQKKTRDRIIFGGLILLFVVFAFYQWYLFKHKKRKQLAEQELIKEQELNEARSRFLENISHEIRTPITLINGYLTLAIEKNKDNPDLEKYIRSAMSSSKKVLDNANEILELQKLERGQMPIERSDIALGTFFRRVFYSFESLAKLKKITLVYRPENLSGISINSDKNRIEKILNNFISNAIKFSPAGSELIFEAGANQGLLTVKVIDSGPGIAVGEQEKIFDRFYQSSNTGNIGGVGVGLSLASDFAKSLGGNVSVESELGKGATFCFMLPVETFVGKEKAEKEKIEVGAKAKNRALTLGDKPKLLIVEDNPEMNEYLQEILCNQFDCDIAFDGAEGLQKTLSKKYSLIVSDVMMPQMDGFELKRRINALKHYTNIPFVFITAKAQLPNKIEGYNLGVDGYITKPFEKDELLARVRSLMINKKERENWAKENPDFVGDDKNTEEQLLSKIKLEISKQMLDENFNVSTLAENVAYSPRQLNRIVKRMTGLTPLQLILEMRLQKANICLSEKKFATISETRNSVGMPSAAYFNKKFEERFGIKPSALIGK